ncbi:Crp/Fnr family transcriptional regulator [Dyadobacter sp. CY261]|uniref:Crp/Fnr family transcriptional regulator n=1 Tax=Dyadobacter sp. CY261 TaxID=2907203 RepID=UPI001F25DE65|nr:Crp/Fnr family transcriptional regulator [Dyadobacter sp. CY261]MCF0069296.1 Crp/Fnr family transcriptional regulator [Dyadobacter sp. CY261]
MVASLEAHFARLISLTPAELEYVSSHFTLRKFRKHQFLVQQGSRVINDFFVVKGLLKSSFVNDQGKEHILQLAMEDWWVSDYQAYFNQTDATLDITCIEDVEVLCLPLASRERLCSELHQIEHFFRKKSNAGYIALQRRILSFMNQSAAERYNELLQMYPALAQRVPKTVLASYLGVSRETLSRLSS